MASDNTMTERTEETTRDETGFPLYTIVVDAPLDAWRQPNGRPGFVNFSVYQVMGVADDGTVLYPPPESVSSMETTTLGDAERCARGSVKWDGCVNYEVGEIDHDFAVMLHACDAKGLREFFAAIERAYEIAVEMVGAEA